MPPKDKTYWKEYYKENREKQIEVSKKYYEENKEAIYEKKKIYNQRDYVKEKKRLIALEYSHRPEVIEARKEYRRQWRVKKLKDDPGFWKKEAAKNKETQDKYYENNKDKILKQKKEYNKTEGAKDLKRVRDSEYSKNNRDKMNAYRNEWRAERRKKDSESWKKEKASDEIVKKALADYRNKPGMDAVLAKRAREYCANNPEENKEKCKAYREKKLTEDPDHWKKEYAAADKKKIKARTIANKFPLANKCEHCGAKPISRHHHKGYDFPEEFESLCKKCHEEADRKYKD